jgi:hypothetical protein
MAFNHQCTQAKNVEKKDTAFPIEILNKDNETKIKNLTL